MMKQWSLDTNVIPLRIGYAEDGLFCLDAVWCFCFSCMYCTIVRRGRALHCMNAMYIHRFKPAQ